MNRETFLESFGHIADAPGGIDKLRSMILDLAMRGKLTSRLDEDENVTELLARIDAAREAKIAARKMRRPKNLGNPSPAQTPHPIPAEWRWVRASRIAHVIGGGTPNANDPANFEEPGIPWITPADMARGKVRGIARGSRGLSAQGLATSSATLLPPGSLVFSSRAPIGYVAVAQNELATNQGFKSLVPHAMECSPFLYWGLRAYCGAIASLGSGTTFSEVSGTVMESVPLPLPPLGEQRRIVERIEQLMDLCDELEQQQAAQVEARSALTASTLNRVAEADSATNARAGVRVFADHIGLHLVPGEGDLAALNRVRQTILDLAVRGRLTHQDSEDEPATELLERIASERAKLIRTKAIRRSAPPAKLDPDTLQFEAPTGWTWCTLGELLISNEAGWSPVCPAEPRSSLDQWGVLKLSAVSWRQFFPHEHKVLAAGLAPRPAIEVRDGDFLMSRANTAALVGRSVVVDNPPPRLMMSDLIVRLRFVDRVTAEYVNVLNGTRAVRALYAAVSKGTSDTMRKLSRDQILATPVPLPPIEEQTRIVRRVAELSVLCDHLQSQFTAARALRADVAASVAAHAVSGTPPAEEDAARHSSQEVGRPGSEHVPKGDQFGNLPSDDRQRVIRGVEPALGAAAG
ncbi:restriction endonuclease subunit S [Sinomonas sp. RB5]